MSGFSSRWVSVLIAIVVAASPAAAQQSKAPQVYRPTAAEREQIAARTAELAKALATLAEKETLSGEDLADVAVYHKAAEWIVRHGEFFTKDTVAMTLKALDRGLARALDLAKGQTPWADAKGATVRGYVSKVDGSVQPYVVIVPAGGLGEGRHRLDVVLHGRGATLNEVTFIGAHDGKPAPADQRGLVLHVFGRTNNAYRWAGEADVFEAIDAVRRLYPIDERRIVLRGFSMGGAGAWHLGLHHPSSWCSVEAGAGFTETRNYAKLVDLPDVQEKALHVYDAVDYALNAFDVPIAGYGGEDDPQLRASANILDRLRVLDVPMHTDGLVTRAEGIDFLQVVGARMGHRIDPVSAQLLAAFHDEHAADRREPPMPRIRFETYTVKYGRVGWLSIEELHEHYKRATLVAEVEGEDVSVRTENVGVLGVDRQVGQTIRLDGQELPLIDAVRGLLPLVYFQHTARGWQVLDYGESRVLQENLDRRKHRNVQGPIDDAFTGPFLCVRGTGTPWNPAVGEWAEARLVRFARTWDKRLRGQIRIKDDADVTAEDIEGSHLILFGDPGSNSVLARVLAGLPLSWAKDKLHLGDDYASAAHAPVLIAPNPLNPLRYIVVNSGHTFGDKEFAGSNALLYPRLGDYAVFAVEDDAPKTSGYFDEGWKAR